MEMKLLCPQAALSAAFFGSVETAVILLSFSAITVAVRI